MHKRSKAINLIAGLTMGIVLITVVLLILVANGIINVTTTDLVFTSESLTAQYSGSPLTAPEWTLKQGSIKPGHTLTVKVSGEQTNVGTSENYITAIITDSNGVDVSHDYNITYNPGTLTVTQRRITVIAASAEKMFDGQPLSDENYKVDPVLSLVKGHRVHATVEGEQTEIGESDNVVTSVSITDGKGRDVTHNYYISTARGKLTVHGYDELVISTESSEADYNASPLKNSRWTLDDGELAEGHQLSVKVTGSQTDVGTSNNDFYVEIRDKNGQDVTYRYNITKNPGTLTVNPQSIVISSPDAQKVYDGEPLADRRYDHDKLYAPGATVQAQVTGSQTAIGSSKNTISYYVILSADNEDITRNYDITIKEGELLVVENADGFKNKITITTGSATKEYDGKPLTEDFYLVDGKLKDGHTIIVQNSGTQTIVGKAPNITHVLIIDENGSSVNDQYFIDYKYGDLIVKPRKITVTTASASKLYDGAPLINPEYAVTPDFLNDEFKFFFTVIGSQTEVGKSSNEADKVNYSIYLNNVEVDKSNFEITWLYGELEVFPVNEEPPVQLVFKSEGAEKVYDGTPLTNHKCSLVWGQLKDGHYPVYDVTGTVTDVGEEDNTFTVTIVDSEGNDVSDQYSIIRHTEKLEVTPMEVTVTAKSDTKTYDGTPLVNNNYDVTPGYLRENGFMFFATVEGSRTEVGSSDNVVTDCLVYNTNGDDVTGNFAITYEKGLLTVLEEPLDLNLVYSSENAEKIYDGEPLYNQKWTRESGDLKRGHREIVSVSKSITDVGKEENTISVKIVDTYGLDVTYMYKITLEPGILEVKPIEVTIKAGSAEKIYDAKSLTNEKGFAVSPVSAIPAGFTVIVSNIGSQTDVGSSDNIVSYWQILDKNNNDVSKNYKVTLLPGKLTVTPLEFTLIAGSAEKHYDTIPLTCPDYRIDPEDILPEGFTCEVVTRGERTEPGVSPNVIESFVFYDSNGNDITHNLKVNTEGDECKGTLTVHKPIIHVTAKDDQRFYNGLPLTNDGYDSLGEEFIPVGGYLEVVVEGEQTVVGSSPNKIASCKVYDKDGNDITDFFEIDDNDGTLTVWAVKLTVTANSAEKFYDGAPLTDPGFEYIIELPEGYRVEALVEGEQIIVGESDNVLLKENVKVLDKDGNDFTSCYDIETVYGTLTVDKAPLTITTEDGKKYYDGTPLTNGNYSVEGEEYIPEGGELIIEIGGSQTEPDSSDNFISRYTVYNADGEDVTEYYEVEEALGTLTVEKLAFTITTDGDQRPYNGLPLTNPNYSLSDFKGLTEDMISVTVNGSQTEAGQSENTAIIVVTLSEDIVIDTPEELEKYCDINYNYGLLIVEKIKFNVIPNSAEKVYDGKPLYAHGFTHGAPDGFTIEVEIEGSRTVPGVEKNIAKPETFKVYDASGADITAYCEPTFEEGELTVTPIVFTMTAGTPEPKQFDNTPLTYDHAEITDEGDLPEGYVLVWAEGKPKTQGSITEPKVENGIVENGVADNVIIRENFRIMYDFPDDGIDELVDITAYCDPILENGTLTVTPIEITITAGSQAYTYDGEEKTYNKANVVQSSNRVDVVFGENQTTGSITEPEVIDGIAKPATAKNEVIPGSYKVLFDTDPDDGIDAKDDPDGALDITRLCKITLASGTITVNPPTFTLTVGSSSKYFDGTPLTNDSWTLSSTGTLPSWFTVEEVPGTQMADGTVTYAFEGPVTNRVHEGSYRVINTKTGEDVTRFCTMRQNAGTLTVMVVPINVISDSAADWYTGSPLKNSNYTIELDKERADKTNPPDDHVLDLLTDLREKGLIDISIIGEITNIGSETNTIEENLFSITDIGGTDITSCYDINFIEGTLTVDKIPIILKTGSAERPFDANEPLTKNEYELNYKVQGHLDKIGATITVVINGSQFDIGSSFNTIESITVKDKYGNDLSEYCVIDLENEDYLGTLEVTANKLTIIAKDDEKPYDTTPLTNGGFDVEGEEFLPSGAQVTITVKGSQTVVGESENTCLAETLKITDKDGNDITEEYLNRFDVVLIHGTLKVTPRDITLKPEYAHDYYTGEALTSDKILYDISDYDGEYPFNAEIKVEAQTDGSQTEVGWSYNAIVKDSWKITDAQGNDITANFNVKTDTEILKIDKMKFTVDPGDFKKEYDGTPLVPDDSKLTVTPDSDEFVLPDGAQITVSFKGEATKIGEYEDIVEIDEDSFKITLDGVDITSNYDFTFEKGDITITDNSPENEEEILIYTAWSNITGSVFMKHESYGDYIFQGYSPWAKADEYTELMEEKYSAAYLSAMALAASNNSSIEHNLNIYFYNSGFAMEAPYYAFADGSTSMSDVMVDGTTKENSSLTIPFYYTIGHMGVTVPEEYAEFEEEYRKHVYATYLKLDDETRAYMEGIISEYGWDASSSNIHLLVANFIQQSADYENTPEVNSHYTSCDNAAIEFFSYGKAVCRQYATAATALFRALGIPARYTTGHRLDLVANEEFKATSLNGHAWVEIYVDGFGWMPVEVTGSDNEDDDKTTVAELFNLKPKSVYVPYSEGSTDVVTSTSIDDLDKLISTINDEHGSKYGNVTASFKIHGSRAKGNPGKTASSIAAISFFDENGNDITDFVYSYYGNAITHSNGIIQVYYGVLRFTSAEESYERTYDGTPLKNTTAHIEKSSGTLLEGHSYTVTADGEIVNVGTKNSTFQVTVTDASGANITDCYRIVRTYGTLKITPKEITFTAGSASQMFEINSNKYLTCNEIVKVDVEEPIEGHELKSWTIESKISLARPGSCDNVITSVVIVDENGKDVTENYHTKFVAGKLTVTFK